MSGVMASTAFDVGPLEIGPTPIAILISTLAVGAVLLVLFVIFSQAGAKVVDKRWPANEPLTPSEVLWGESGGHVKKAFPGLDPDIARDLTQYMHTKKVGPGTVILEAGDLPTEFVLLKSGAAEVIDAAGKSTPAKAGEGFGADDIIRRRPHEVTVRTTAASEIVSLDAEDYLAGVALGMSDDDDDYVVHMLGGYFRNEPVMAAAPAAAAPASAPLSGGPPPPPGFGAPPAAPRTGPPPPPQPPAPPSPPRWALASHRVGASELPAFLLPAGDRPTRSLPPGTPLNVLESLPGWAHIATEDGFQGWVAETGITRL